MKMTHKVSSFVADGWYTAPDEGHVVVDASTGEPVAVVSSTGLDTEHAVQHARTVGGPALRSLTFPQRALLLKRLSAYLAEHTEAIYAEYGASGATMADARVDVEGALNVLNVYAAMALKGLPNDTILVEGTVGHVLVASLRADAVVL